MSIDLLLRLEKLALFFVILFLPITGLPKRFSISFLGNNLSMYFLFIGMLLVVYEYTKQRTIVRKSFIKYFCIYALWQLICLVIGLYSYEYNEYLTIEQSPKLLVILNFLSKHGLIINDLLALKIWLLIRSIRDILFLNNQVLALAFLVWHLYHGDWEKGFYDVRKAILSLVIVMGTYSFIELLWLKMQIPFTEELLKTINVFLYDPENSHGWWPPLLWRGQLRSLCPEPPFFSIISILCLPFVWSFFFSKRKNMFYYVLLVYYSMMIFATNARTATVVVTLEFLFLVAMVLIIKNKEWIKSVVSILICMSIGFLINLINFNDLHNGREINIAAELNDYTKNNIVSAVKKDVRSNNARLANMIATFETIKDYPVFGVGYGLKDAYVDARLPEFSYSNDEVRNWSRYMHNEGVLKSGYPLLNQYLDVGVNNGVIGLILYLFPVFYFCKKLLVLYKINLLNYMHVVVFISFCGLLVAQLTNAYMLICNGVTWGLMLCMVENDNDLRATETTN